MNVGIVGAGFVGMTVALDLQKRGHTVTLFESEDEVGGLAMGFRAENWDWSLEKHYHHIFKTDTHILDFAKELGVSFDFKLPKTSMLVNDSILQIDSPLNLLKFNALSFQDKSFPLRQQPLLPKGPDVHTAKISRGFDDRSIRLIHNH